MILKFVSSVIAVSSLLVVLTGCESLPSGSSVNSRQFDVEIVSAKFEQATPTLANMFDPSVKLNVPHQGLPIAVSVTPKSSFTGEPFLTKRVEGKEFTQSQPIWVLLYAKDGYLFGWQGPVTWTPNELRPPDTAERDYYYLQALSEQKTKTVTFWVSGSDKAVVALKDDIETYLTDLKQEDARRWISGDWLSGDQSMSERIARINEETLKMVNQHFRAEIADKNRVAQLLEEKREREQ